MCAIRQNPSNFPNWFKIASTTNCVLTVAKLGCLWTVQGKALLFGLLWRFKFWNRPDFLYRTSPFKNHTCHQVLGNMGMGIETWHEEPGEGRHHESEREIRRQILPKLQLQREDCSSEFEKNVMRHLVDWQKCPERSLRRATCLTDSIHQSKSKWALGMR